MRYSLAISLASAAASLAGPLQTGQNKMEFMPPWYGPWGGCETPYHPDRWVTSEYCVGTLHYCTKGRYRNGENYTSSKACYDAREPPLFIEPSKDYEACTTGKWKWGSFDSKKEICRGTKEFCDQKLYEGTIETYDNPEQCINARRRKKMPFFEHWIDCWNGPGIRPNASEDSENCQGTVDYCTNKFYKLNGESYDSPAACFEAREPPPFIDPFDSWLCEDGTSQSKQEFCLGTLQFCNQRQYEGTIETYNNTEECIKARGDRRPKPRRFEAPVWTKRPTKAELPANTELPTEAEACKPFRGNSTACYLAMGDCVNSYAWREKKGIIKCVGWAHEKILSDAAARVAVAAAAAAGVELPTGQGLCNTFYRNNNACYTAVAECLGKGKDHAKKAVNKCVLDIAASSLDTPTEEELCLLFPVDGGSKPCKAASKLCFDKHKTKVARIQCVYDIARAPTEEELCPPFNGNMTACIDATKDCLRQHRGRRKVVLECVHDIAETPSNEVLCPYALFGPYGERDCAAASKVCFDKHKTKAERIKCVHAAATPTEEELCPPFNGDRQACIAVSDVCLNYNRSANKRERIACMQAHAAAATALGPELPTEAELCPPYNGDIKNCLFERTICIHIKANKTKDIILKCVHARAPKRPTETKLPTKAEQPTKAKLPAKAKQPTEPKQPTDAELCLSFDEFGGKNACNAAKKVCFGQHNTTVEAIKCVRVAAIDAAAEQLTNTSICLPFNGDMQACSIAIKICTLSGKLIREAIIKCAHARAPKQPTETKLPTKAEQPTKAKLPTEAEQPTRITLFRQPTEAKLPTKAEQPKLAARAEQPTEPKLPTGPELPTEADICEPFDGDRDACINAIDLCGLIDGEHISKEEMIKCVHDMVELGVDLRPMKEPSVPELPTGPGIPTEEDLCYLFKNNRTACITETNICLDKVKHTKKAITQCVRAAAAAAAAPAPAPAAEIPTVAEVCPQANGKEKKQACSYWIKSCAEDHKTKEAISKCVHDYFAMMPKQVKPAEADLCPPFNGDWRACKKAIRICFKEDMVSEEKLIKCVHARAPKRPTEPKLAARADLPTEAELCPPFAKFGGTEACKKATKECYEKDRHLMSSKKALINCVHAAAKSAVEELCQPFNGAIWDCADARTLCAYNRKTTREAMIKCVHDIAAERPTEEEVCPLFDKVGGRNFCIDAAGKCLTKYYTKVEILKCAHDIAAAAAIANQITDEELCLPFNGDKEKCKSGRTKCIESGKLTKKAMIECVKDFAAKGPVNKEYDDPPIWSP
ncbi:hypothetical protein E5D57_009142 [Metarhizium anisopliae]|nr:hypothetical protein E5D57_009142 [Metarhizium anisopliae]